MLENLLQTLNLFFSLSLMCLKSLLQLRLIAVILTGMGEARNAVIVASADAVIAVGGSWGTLSEIALAKRRSGIPVISLGGWRLTDAREAPISGITYVATPEEAVAEAVAPSGL